MVKNKCVICNDEIEDVYGKLKGTIVKVKNEKKESELIYVCSNCQKKDNWIEDAKVKGV
jgi:uncharacterized protein with PIN domain